MKQWIFPAFASAWLAFSAQDVAPPPLARAAAFMKDYMRGVTENRFDISTTLTTTDLIGKVVSTRKAKYRLEYVKGRFKGAGMDESQEGDWGSTIRISHSTRQMVSFELVNDIELLMAPAFVFGPNARSKWSFDVLAPADTAQIRVDYRSIEPCNSFEATAEGFRPKRGFCGKGQVEIDESGPLPLRARVEAIGLPLTSGKKVLTAYWGESEFQYISLPGTRQRLVFPKNTTGTFVFQNRKMTIQSSYTFHPGKW